jgi:hypothetical protein
MRIRRIIGGERFPAGPNRLRYRSNQPEREKINTQGLKRCYLLEINVKSRESKYLRFTEIFQRLEFLQQSRQSWINSQSSAVFVVFQKCPKFLQTV